MGNGEENIGKRCITFRSCSVLCWLITRLRISIEKAEVFLLALIFEEPEGLLS